MLKKEFPFPKCWSDDTRMDVLFSPFRPKSVNPENYDAKLNFWKDIISKYCEYKGTCVFCKSEIISTFTRKGKKPYAIDTVLQDMIEKKEIFPKDDFINSLSNSWTYWVMNLMKKPIQWGGLMLSPTENNIEDQQFVNMDILKKQSDDLKSILRDYEGKILSFEELSNINTGLNADGLLICLKLLNSTKKIYLDNKDDNRKNILIKVPNEHEVASPLSEMEKTLYRLKQVQTELSINIEDRENVLKTNDERVRKYIREGNKIAAKRLLRESRSLRGILEKKMSSLENIQSLITSVEEAKMHGVVVDAYKTGSDTLKALLTKPELNLSNVDDITLAVKETIEATDEIQASLGTPLNDGQEDSSLEKELDELLNAKEPPKPTKTQKDTVPRKAINDKVLTPEAKIQKDTVPTKTINEKVITPEAGTQKDRDSTKHLTPEVKTQKGIFPIKAISEEELLSELEKLELEMSSPKKSENPPQHVETSITKESDTVKRVLIP